MMNPFLDLVAGVDYDPEEEEVLGSDEGDFIDDDDACLVNNSSASSHVRWPTADEPDTRWEDLLTRVYQRVQAAPSSITLPSMREGPNDDDCPLWRVRCRTGSEEEAIFSLLQRTNATHQLRSAFVRGSTRGWVYLECRMNTNLLHLLRRMPGIVLSNGAIVREPIPRSDWTRTLRMQDPKMAVKPNQWVEICTGFYKGDYGLVTDIYNDLIEVLVVPRLKRKDPGSVQTSKRKRTAVRPPPSLFTPSTSENLYGLKPISRNGSWFCQGLVFNYGLLQKLFSLHSISIATSIPSGILGLFVESEHPKVLCSDFPRPQEWILECGERVIIRSSAKLGTVCRVDDFHVEVDLASGEGQVSVSWRNLQKAYILGDHVRIMAGCLCGQTGWVERIDGDSVSILIKNKSQANSNTSAHTEIETYHAHRNWLKIEEVPFLHASLTSNAVGHRRYDVQVPWIGIEVVVIKAHHVWRGSQAIVKDVINNQLTASGLKVEVELARYGPSDTFRRLILDHEDVVEQNSQMKLLHFLPPNGGPFQPLASYKYVNEISAGLTKLMPTRSPFRSKPSTPFWNSSSSVLSVSKTPAWNPSSRTPDYARCASPPRDFSSHLADTTATLDRSPTPKTPSIHGNVTPVLPNHPLFDLRLVGAQPKVIIHGGAFTNKEAFVTVAEEGGHIKVQHKVLAKTTYLEANWITIKQPVVARDTNLLVVIKGEHTGKYVRRIHHKGNSMILGVVNRIEGAIDKLLDERLEIGVDSLAIVYESKQQRDLNKSLMTAVRNKHRHYLYEYEELR